MGSGKTTALIKQLDGHLRQGDTVVTNLNLSEERTRGKDYILVRTLEEVVPIFDTVVVGLDACELWFHDESLVPEFLTWMERTKSTVYLTTYDFGYLDHRIKERINLVLSAKFEGSLITLVHQFEARSYQDYFGQIQVLDDRKR